MFNTTKTIYSVMLDVANILGKPHVVLPSTTLNEKFKVMTPNTETQNPKLRYYALGLEYESLVQNTSINIDMIRHKPTDGSLFRHIPFIARPVDSDLTATERDRYRLRTTRFVDGKEHAFYFIKLIDEVSTNSKLLMVSNVNNESFLNTFSTEVSDILEPEIEERDSVDSSQIDYIAYSQHISITITEDELKELYNATKLLYGTNVFDGDSLTLGEIGIISGNEAVDENGFKEIANAQINYFLKIDHVLTDINLLSKFTKTIEMGGMSPMVFRTYNE